MCLTLLNLTIMIGWKILSSQSECLKWTLLTFMPKFFYKIGIRISKTNKIHYLKPTNTVTVRMIESNTLTSTSKESGKISDLLKGTKETFSPLKFEEKKFGSLEAFVFPNSTAFIFNRKWKITFDLYEYVFHCLNHF